MPPSHAPHRKFRTLSRHSFTLIELLIVIAIIAVLATVVILVLNPAQLLAQARDSTRMSDMTNLKQALSLYQTDVGGSLGNSTSTLYISIPDPTATSTAGDQCQGLGLSTSSLPSGWSYHCAASSTYKDVNGTGWIPINFQEISSGPPLASLPVDPTNTTSSGLYYTYVGYGDTWEITALFESSKYQAKAAEDGGPDPAAYEVGSDLTLSPFTHGLVGYWPLDEGSGTIAYDQSGFGNNGTWGGTATGTSGYYSPGLNQTWAGAFDGTTTDIIGSDITVPADFTIVAWTLQVASSGQETIFSNRNGGVLRLGTGVNGGKNMILLFDHNASPIGVIGGMYPTGQWQFVAVARTPSVAEIYLNGTSVVSQTWSGYSTSTGYLEIGRDPVVGQSWNGFIEDVRVYNRALSASEIQAIYNSEK